MSSSATPFRPFCYRCHKAQIVCVCDTVPRVENSTEIIILQHPRERFHPIGTVRFAKLGLARVRVVVDHPRERRRGAGLTDHPTEVAAGGLDGLGLLYPSRTARLLTDVPPGERPRRLLVLDGTWSQARSLYKSNPWLRGVPAYALAPARPGQYRIRLEPDARSLSTVEAIVQSLAILEPETAGLDGLLEAFGRMIDRQIAYASAPTPRPSRTTRAPKKAPIPALLTDSPSRVIVAHGERIRMGEAPGTGRWVIVYWAASRLDGSETFSAFVRPPELSPTIPTEQVLRHLGLPREALASGGSAEELAARWAAFVRPGDVVTTWSQSTLRGLAEVVPLPPGSMALKTTYCNTTRRACGALAEVFAERGLTAVAGPFAGRTGELLGQLLPIVRWLAGGGRPLSGPPTGPPG